MLQCHLSPTCVAVPCARLAGCALLLGEPSGAHPLPDDAAQGLLVEKLPERKAMVVPSPLPGELQLQFPSSCYSSGMHTTQVCSRFCTEWSNSVYSYKFLKVKWKLELQGKV